MKAAATVVACFAMVVASPAISQENNQKKSESAPVAEDAAPAEAPGLHNVVCYGPGFLSGSVPEGDAGFATLRAWGIRTVLSVDGASPDVERAARFGIRYVHLPIGYDGFDAARKLELVRAVRDLPRPLYIHCHHGKHRSAGAAATIAASLGWLSPAQAVARMKVSGTSTAYPGLYACAANAVLLAASAIDQAPSTFPERVRPTGLVESMVLVDDSMERLKQARAAGWLAPPDHPDLAPAADAGTIADHLRNARPASPDAGFAAWAERCRDAAQRLEGILAASAPVDRAAADQAMHDLTETCTACHAACRDRRRAAADSPKP